MLTDKNMTRGLRKSRAVDGAQLFFVIRMSYETREAFALAGASG
jgi:hypothetical protein